MKFNKLYNKLLSEAAHHKKDRSQDVVAVTAATTRIYFPAEDELYKLSPGNWELISQGEDLSDREGDDVSSEINKYFPNGFRRVRVSLGRDIMNVWPTAIVFPNEELDHFIVGDSYPKEFSELVFIDPRDSYNLDQETRDEWDDIIKEL
jgi:hypothetical protein